MFFSLKLKPLSVFLFSLLFLSLPSHFFLPGYKFLFSFNCVCPGVPSYLDYLPSLLASKKPYDAARLQGHLGCPGRLGHQCPNPMFVGIVDLIREEMVAALVAYYTANQLTLPSSELVIYMRCGDIFKYGQAEYGFLRYSVYKQLIPAGVRDISLVLSPIQDPGQPHGCRPKDCAFQAQCQAVYKDVTDWLKSNYPEAIVTSHFGETQSQSLARMVFAKTLICNPSTFCLWPAIATQGRSYLNRGILYFNTAQPDLGKQTVWLDTPHVNMNEYMNRIGSVEGLLSELHK